MLYFKTVYNRTFHLKLAYKHLKLAGLTPAINTALTHLIVPPLEYLLELQRKHGRLNMGSLDNTMRYFNLYKKKRSEFT